MRNKVYVAPLGRSQALDLKGFFPIHTAASVACAVYGAFQHHFSIISAPFLEPVTSSPNPAISPPLKKRLIFSPVTFSPVLSFPVSSLFSSLPLKKNILEKANIRKKERTGRKRLASTFWERLATRYRGVWPKLDRVPKCR